MLPRPARIARTKLRCISDWRRSDSQAYADERIWQLPFETYDEANIIVTDYDPPLRRNPTPFTPVTSRRPR